MATSKKRPTWGDRHRMRRLPRARLPRRQGTRQRPRHGRPAQRLQPGRHARLRVYLCQHRARGPLRSEFTGSPCNDLGDCGGKVIQLYVTWKVRRRQSRGRRQGRAATLARRQTRAEKANRGLRCECCNMLAPTFLLGTASQKAKLRTTCRQAVSCPRAWPQRGLGLLPAVHPNASQA